MIYLVDGFNVIYKMPQIDEFMHRGQLEKAMRGLLQTIFEFRGRLKKHPEFHVFFDGKKKQGDERIKEQVSDMFVYYSHDLSADHLIKRYVRTTPSPGEVWVVSSDKDIRRYAKKHRCHVESSEEFSKRVRETLAPKTPDEPEKDVNPRLSNDEVSYWEKLFKRER